MVGRALFAAGAIMMTSTAHAQNREERIDPSDKQMAALQALNPVSVEKIVEIKDDDLDTVATLSTFKAYQDKGGFTDRVRSDNMFRAFVDKRSGYVRYQLYQTLSYSSEYRNFTSVTFASASGPKAAKLTSIAHDVIGCFGGVCAHRDIIGFDLDQQEMEEIAATYVAGRSPMWRFKFRAQSGIDWEDRISPAEAVGLLAAVGAFKAAHVLPVK